MKDATLAQGNRLFELILRESDPRRFAQSLIGNWGTVQTIGRGQLDQSTLKRAVGRAVNPYADVKYRPALTYPKGYKPSSVEEQVGIEFRMVPGDADRDPDLYLDPSSVSSRDGGLEGSLILSYRPKCG